MPEQIRWTVLPDGTAPDGGLRLTVLVTPRLTGAATLDGFPGFRDWPATLAARAAALRVAFRAPGAGGTGVLVPAAPRQDRFPPADSALWRRLFPPSTPVRPPGGPAFAADGPPPVLRSYPGRDVHDRVTALYTAVATATARRRAFPPGGGEGAAEQLPPRWDHPALDDLLTPLTTPVLDLARAVAAAYPALDALFTAPSAAAPNPYRPRTIDRSGDAYRANAAVHNAAEAYRFYDRPAAPAPRQPPERPDLDFHTACALLADHPELLRRLGLALDLVAAPPPGLADRWLARVHFTDPQGGLNADESLRPWTDLRHVPGARFEPYAPDDGPYGRRMLRLAGPGTLVTDLDVDGAALAYVEFSRIVGQALAAAADPRASTAPDATAPPALHGAGLTVLRDGGDAELADRMEADARNAAGVGPAGEPVPAAVLDASHLVRGYRVDVGRADPATGAVTAWLPLCARTGTYAIRPAGQPPLPLAVAPDEGHVKAGAVGEDAAGQLYAHQALFGWHGWSLAAPPPGRTLGPDDRPVVPVSVPDPRFPLDAAFRPPPGSLPALRYGHTYRVRARLCDLAGNGPGPGADVPDDVASAPVTHRRWEPVPPPAVVPRWPFLEGESEARLVIRSTVDDAGVPVPAGAWAALRTAQVPDHTADTPVDHLDRRYRGFDERHIAPPKSPLQTAERHGVYDDVFGPDVPDAVRRRWAADAGREAGSFLDTVVSLPEDPFVTRDLAFFGEIHVAKHDPHDTGPLTELPVPRGAGLAPGEYVVHDAAQLLLPYLPDVPARGVSLRGLPGAAPNETYDFPGPWPQARPLRLRIVEGDGPPVRSGPAARELTVRLPKATVATVRMSCLLDTADLELFGAWRLLTDSALWAGLPRAKKDELTAAAAAGENWMITPWAELTLVHAVEKPLEEPELGPLAFPREEGRTFTPLAGRVRSHARSTGRVDIDATWSEWTDDVSEDAPRRTDGHARVGDVTLRPADDDRSLFGVRHEFRDTRHRNVTYTPVATTRFREYFHPAITGRPELITRRGPGSGPWPVPSSRRPEPPDVSHLVPTVRWESAVDHDRHRVTRTRRHAGFRVHLRRPWFSSGDDELLAVVLGDGLPDELATRCARDPAGADAGPLRPLALADFPAAVRTATGVVLAEPVAGAPATASVAAFAPAFDAELGLWTCDVDFALPEPAYFPHVRLALARYQPYSVDPLHLSGVTTAGFLQPLPDRTVTATMTAAGAVRLELSGPVSSNALGARAGTGRAAMAASRRVLATVERRAAGGGDLDWAGTGTVLELTCAPAAQSFTWSGDLTLPAPQLLPPSEYRVLVEEFELHATDPATATDTVTAGGTAVPAGRRLVHADRFALTVSLLGRLVLRE
ncbi:hypothetical protein [Streptomyces caatingaensis]|uniref:Uncharacterized protein n=1 Tax=Streptomyces caatingaensis TaxID=1678637 RepID=A0A0K9XJN8_9ACTN|nr:hypothetical protein [Streptomyces caatingaensis]KNB52872.1 hypothetical protein AC230_09575 [Streptomyces caatingaensis]